MINKKDRQETFLAAFERNACNISAGCRAAGMTRQTYYLWMDKDYEFAEKVAASQEALIDFAESALIKNIRDGKETSLIFFLKCKAKKRGYIDRYEYDKPQGLGISTDDLKVLARQILNEEGISGD